MVAKRAYVSQRARIRLVDWGANALITDDSKVNASAMRGKDCAIILALPITISNVGSKRYFLTLRKLHTMAGIHSVYCNALRLL